MKFPADESTIETSFAAAWPSPRASIKKARLALVKASPAMQVIKKKATPDKEAAFALNTNFVVSM